MRYSGGFFAAIVLGLLLAVPAQAQVTTADLVGRVTDSSGGVLPGATVTRHQRGHARRAGRDDR